MIKHMYLILMVSAILLLSCEVKFASNTRIQVIGALVNNDGEPISDAEISVYTIKSSGGFINAPGPVGSDEYLLGRNYSNQDGTFEVTSLFDRNKEFSIVITNGSNYTNYIYATSTYDYIPEDLTFDLGTLTLRKTSTIDYNVTRTSGEDSTFRFNFNFKDTDCFEYFVEGILDSGLSYCYRDATLGEILNYNKPNIEGMLKAPYGTEVEFTYSINEQDNITETFIIDQENYEFTFTY